MLFIPYNKNLKEFSRQLRNNSTLSEVLLWNELKAEKMFGYQFNRQKPLGTYIVDFYCKKLNLVIEIDGNSHGFDDIYLNDLKRQNILESFGLKFLRFSDLQVKMDMMNVIKVIENFIKESEGSRFNG
jgi:very-short-patch-repair endonuclease